MDHFVGESRRLRGAYAHFSMEPKTFRGRSLSGTGISRVSRGGSPTYRIRSLVGSAVLCGPFGSQDQSVRRVLRTLPARLIDATVHGKTGIGLQVTKTRSNRASKALFPLFRSSSDSVFQGLVARPGI